MEQNDSFYQHESILLEACINALHIKPAGVYVDCTTGGAGHSQAILQQLGQGGTLLCFDKDKTALAVAKIRLEKLAHSLANKTGQPNAKVFYINQDFSKLREVLTELGIAKIDGILADLGVSSYQLDEASRGFSYQKEGPLDMRMNIEQSLTAASFLSKASLVELKECFYTYGEEKYSASIAQNIIKARVQNPITTTKQLVEIIYKSIPAKARREAQHPAKRVFQALRIKVNDELGALEKLLKDLPSCLQDDARVVFLSFHSLEDRIIKQAFKTWQNPCVCPKSFPYCQCKKVSLGKIVDKGKLPNQTEIEQNHRSRSARIRSFHFLHEIEKDV